MGLLYEILNFQVSAGVLCITKTSTIGFFWIFGHEKTSNYAHLKRVGGLSVNISGDLGGIIKGNFQIYLE